MNNLEGWNSHLENAKAEKLERLYRMSGRNNGLYTGLYKKHNRWYRKLLRFLKALLPTFSITHRSIVISYLRRNEN